MIGVGKHHDYSFMDVSIITDNRRCDRTVGRRPLQKLRCGDVVLLVLVQQGSLVSPMVRHADDGIPGHLDKFHHEGTCIFDVLDDL